MEQPLNTRRVIARFKDQDDAQLNQAMASKQGLSAGDLKKTVAASMAKGRRVYYIDKNGLKQLVKDPSGTKHQVDAYIFAGASNRKGSKAFGAGFRVDNSYGIEASCGDEGKQPDGIKNINRICDYDLVKFFPFSDKFRVFVEAGVTAQRGHKGPWWTWYHNPQGFDHGWNVGYGGELETPLKRLYVRVEGKSADYPHLDIPKNEHITMLLNYLDLSYSVPLGHRQSSGNSAE